MVTRSDKTNDFLDNEILLDAVAGYHPLVHGDLHGSLSMSSRPIFRKAPTNSFAFLKLKIKISSRICYLPKCSLFAYVACPVAVVHCLRGRDDNTANMVLYRGIRAKECNVAQTLAACLGNSPLWIVHDWVAVLDALVFHHTHAAIVRFHSSAFFQSLENLKVAIFTKFGGASIF